MENLHVQGHVNPLEFEPSHQKTNNMLYAKTKTQIS